MKRSTVLIVDDESYIREFLAQILSEHFRIAFAKNGKEVVETAKSVQPDIVVLDVLMPGQNGIETCKILREQKESESIPIIMLTAVNEPEQRIAAFNAGADDYLAKPFLPEELVARIKRKLEKVPSRQSTAKDLGFCLGNLKLQFDDLCFEVDGVKCELGQVEYKFSIFF